jgi:predicted dehydrogenase
VTSKARRQSKPRLGMALAGPGFIATHHLDAVRRLGNVEIIGVLGSSPESGRRRAAELGVARAFDSLEEMLSDPAVDVVHNTTPNNMHLKINLATIVSGRHIVSDKPLALDVEQCRILRDAAARASVVNAVTFNYRGNAMVQQMRAMVSNGATGAAAFVQGHYLQDWLADENSYSWRLDPQRGGAASALADIGSHWCDLAEHVTGAHVTHVLADLSTVIATRYVAKTTAESFASTANKSDMQAVAVTGEDLATVLLRFSNGARGAFTVGQILPGHKNDLVLEVNGRDASLRWLQERPDELWIGHAREANSLLTRDPTLLLPEARAYAHTPAGHGQGWPDAFFNVIEDIYEAIRQPGAAPATLCTFANATRVACVVEAMLESHAAGAAWTAVKES